MPNDIMLSPVNNTWADLNTTGGMTIGTCWPAVCDHYHWWPSSTTWTVSADKGKQAIEVVRVLMAKGLVHITKPKDVIALIDEIVKIL